MGWTLAILIIAAIILFIFSIYKNKEASNEEQREIDIIHMTLMDEIKKLQNEVQILDIENEILSEKIGINREERDLQRKLRDLYLKNFNVEMIAARFQLETSEVERLLAPYISFKNEGGGVANES